MFKFHTLNVLLRNKLAAPVRAEYHGIHSFQLRDTVSVEALRGEVILAGVVILSHGCLDHAGFTVAGEVELLVAGGNVQELVGADQAGLHAEGAAVVVDGAGHVALKKHK